MGMGPGGSNQLLPGKGKGKGKGKAKGLLAIHPNGQFKLTKKVKK